MDSAEFETFLAILEKSKRGDGDLRDLSYEVARYLCSPARTEHFLERVLLLDFGEQFYHQKYYMAIASNPNVSQKIINKLAENHGSAWPAIRDYYYKLIESKKLSIPERDYPIQLLDGSDLTEEERILYVFGALHYITEDLWQDLGQHGLLQLQYRPDSIEGTHFGPSDIITSPTESLLSPNGFDCQWIEIASYVDLEILLYDAEILWERYVENEHGDNLESADFATMAVLVHGIASGEIVAYHEEAVQSFLVNLDDAHQWLSDFYFEVDINILDFPHKGFRFRELNKFAQQSLVKNLLAAHNGDVFNHAFGLSEHLLNLIYAHPHTAPSVIEIIEAGPYSDLSTAREYREKLKSGGVID